MHEDLSYAEIFGEEGVQLKLKIMHAVDRSLDQITVSRVCERAGVSRQTFYRNFDSKYSLHWWWPMHVHRFYLAEVGRTIDWETGYYHHVQLLSMEKDYFKVATQYTVNFPCVNSIMPDSAAKMLWQLAFCLMVPDGEACLKRPPCRNLSYAGMQAVPAEEAASGEAGREDALHSPQLAERACATERKRAAGFGSPFAYSMRMAS